MKDSEGKRRIDRLRDSAISMTIGLPEDGAVQTMVSMEDALYSVHEHAIYAIQLADQIDPGRTNEAIPNTHRKLLSMGALDPEVGRIFLTAHAFLQSKFLGHQFPEKSALSLAFKYLQEIAAMLEVRRSLEDHIQEAVRRHKQLPREQRNLGLPALGDAKTRCDAFTQKVGHAVDTLKGIARLFYPGELTRKWITSLAELAKKKHGENAPLTRFMSEAAPTLLFLRELRNMVEHPREEARLDVYDFRLHPSLELIAPSVAITRIGQEMLASELSSFMQSATESLTSLGEMLIALLAVQNAQPFGASPLLLVELPPERRPKWNPHQRLSYGLSLNGAVQPLG